VIILLFSMLSDYMLWNMRSLQLHDASVHGVLSTGQGASQHGHSSARNDHSTRQQAHGRLCLPKLSENINFSRLSVKELLGLYFVLDK